MKQPWEEVLSVLEKSILGNVTAPSAPNRDFPEITVFPIPAEVLYRSLKETDTGKRGWFRKNVIPTYKKELVLRLDENHVHLVDHYLYTLALEVEEARVVSCAALTFTTGPAHPQSTANYKALLEDHIQRNYPLVLVKAELANNVTYEKREGDACHGKLSGSVEEIIELYHFLGNTGWGACPRRLEINFFYKQHQD